jgi:hypothetical protein
VDKLHRPTRYTYRTPAVRALIEAAGPTDRLSVLLRYRPGVKIPEAVAAYREIDGLKVDAGYIPILHVTGDRELVKKALGHELTVGAAKDYQDYSRHFLNGPAVGTPGRG